jgi:hypothetical protein
MEVNVYENNRMKRLPSLILGGTHKAGTTSLFRYLADHPNVCASSKKEVYFFFRYRDSVNEEAIEHYSSYFSHCADDTSIRIEASPGYLKGGITTAQLIKSILPDVKLIFILREPVERLYSLFNSEQGGSDAYARGIAFDDFVDQVLATMQSKETRQSTPHLNKRVEALKEGCYAQFIEAYLEGFEPENICILFFDDLSCDAQGVVKKVCEFVNISSRFYDNYNFTVENRTRFYRFYILQNAAFKLNTHLEPTLNRFPRLRRQLRAVYNLLNEKNQALTPMSRHAKEMVSDYYVPHNIKLRKLLLDTWPGIHLPVWLS